MAAWASTDKFGSVGFLCVCVDPRALATAQEFGQLYFPSAPESLINGYIDNRSDFPDFQAQLGCQGFAIFNSTREIVTSRTAPFLDYRERAFRDVEGKLQKILKASEAPAKAAKVENVDVDVTQYLKEIGSVGHDAMDSQHDSCIEALKEFAQDLSVKKLKVARQEIEAHFADEEALLEASGFGQAPTTGDTGNDFSAYGSHIKDHRRIVEIVDTALSALTNVCEKSDSHGGTVPKQVAIDLCKAFADHAKLYDSLYEGKIAA